MELSLITSNIRFENDQDGPNNWTHRKNVWSKIIKNFQPDILCTQEGRKEQIYEASKQSNLKIIDSHRDWIKERMYPTIFINPDKINIIKSGDFWLSETPSIPGSKSFKSAFPRLCTWAKVKKSDAELFIFNCHLDHILPETRLRQSNVLLNEIRKVNLKNECLIITGDFNESPSEEVRKNIVSQIDVFDPIELGFEVDQGTHHRFDGDNSGSTRIDWILAHKSLKCHAYKIIKENKNGKFPSDHFPVYGRFST